MRRVFRSASYGLLAGALAAPAAAQITFTDVSGPAGVGSEVYDSTTRHSLGINWIDVDNDRWPDLFLVNGVGLSAHLYRNNRDGTFTLRDDLLPSLPNWDMTRSLFSDYDNDGDLDLYILTDHPTLSFQTQNAPDGPRNLFLKNLWMESGEIPGAPLFTECAAAVGLEDLATVPFGPYPGLRAKTGHWMDYDRDGDQDVYVGHMVANSGGELPNADRFYRNNGDGTFSDVTAAVGVDALTDSLLWRPALASIGAHLDDDLWPDLYIANVADPTPFHHDRVFRNNGGTFVDITSVVPGIGDDSWAAMGVDVADIDHDGDWDLYISDLYNGVIDSPPKGNVLYLGNGDGTFQDNSAPAAGVASDNSWGVSFFDADQDTYEDLLVVTMIPITTGPHFFRNNQDGTFQDLTGLTGLTCGDARGSATADYDRDGDLDVAIVNSLGIPMKLFRNDTPAPGHRLQIVLRGTASSRDAIGTLVELDVAGTTLLRQVKGGSSAHSQDELTVHVGLGTATVVDEIRIRWASGITDTLAGVAADQRITVTEGITADPRPVATLSRAHLAFGTVATTDPVDREVLLFNDGSQTLAVSTLSSDDPSFSVVAGPTSAFTVAPGDVHAVTVRFSAVSPGAHGGTLSVTTDDPYDPVRTVALTGTSTAPTAVPLPGPVSSGILSRARPNPFSGGTVIEFDPGTAGRVAVDVYDAAGRHVISLLDAVLEPGPASVSWRGRSAAGDPVPAGVYFYRIRTDRRETSRKLLLLR